MSVLGCGVSESWVQGAEGFGFRAVKVEKLLGLCVGGLAGLF